MEIQIDKKVVITSLFHSQTKTETKKKKEKSAARFVCVSIE